MIYKTVALSFLGIAIQAQAAQVFTIDSQNSFVGAYTPVWVNTGPASSSGTVPSYNWNLEWQLTPFSISGTFEAEILQSPFNPDVTRLQLSDIHITPLAPAYTEFSLPAQLTLHEDGTLYMTDWACYNDFFFGNFSCTGGTLGPIRTDEGVYSGAEISLTGDRSSFFIGFGFAEGPTPPEVTDFSPATGLFSYSIHATAVPEPGTGFLLLGGLGITALFRRRRIRPE